MNAIGYRGIEKWTIRDIEKMTECDAFTLALEKMSIKDHDVYIVDFGAPFGYSAVVFKNGNHVFYANDYELHHQGRTREDLRQWYIDTLNGKLFTDDEITAPLADYNDYSRRLYFLNNYYAMRVNPSERVSIFGIFNTDEQVKEHEEKIKGMTLNPVGLCHMKDKEFIKHHVALFNELERLKDGLAENFEYQKAAFKHEMFNHEYIYNWQADFDVISVFARIRWDENAGAAEYMDQANFTDTQKAAYWAARREYFDEMRKAENI